MSLLDILDNLTKHKETPPEVPVEESDMLKQWKNPDLSEEPAMFFNKESGQMQPVPQSDVSGAGDINALIQQGLAQSQKDKDTMNTLPDVSGTNNLLSMQGKGPLLPTPPSLNKTDKGSDDSGYEDDSYILGKAGSKSPVASSAPITPQQQKDLTLPEPSIEDKMKMAGAPLPKDQEMLNAQASRSKNMQLLAMLSGAQQIGAGFARQKPDENYTKDLQGLAEAPVANLKEARASQEALEKQTMERQKFVLDTEKGKVDFAKAKMDLSDAAQRSDPASQASALARASTIDSLKRMGRDNLAKGITPDTSAAQIEKLYGNMNMSNMVTAYEAQQNRLAMKEMQVEAMKAQRQEKLDQKDTMRLDTASKLIAADLARNNTAFGRNANIIRSSDAIDALVANKDPDKLTQQQIFEVAKSLDAMLSSGAATQSGTEHLMPKGWMQKGATVEEFFRNEPAAAMQGGYVKQAMATIARERALAQSKIQQASNGLLGSYMDLAQKHPESWRTMLQMHGIKPEQVGTTPTAQPVGNIQVDQDAITKELARRAKEGT